MVHPSTRCACFHGPVQSCLLQIDTHDCSKELLEFGARVSHANSRPPIAQDMLK